MAKRLRVAYLERCVGCYQCVLACARVNEKVLSVDRTSIKVRTVNGYEGAFAIVISLCTIKIRNTGSFYR